MSDCKAYPADTVDVYGNVWPTTGENIRNGLFGMKVKRGIIEINNGNITSNDFIISNIMERQFFIDKRAVLIFPIILKEGFASFSFTLAESNKKSVLVASHSLKNLSMNIGVIYQAE